MATTMDGLFGASPYEVEQQQYQKVQDAARQFAQMSPFEKAGMLMYQGGSGLGRMGAEALGGVNVPVQQAQQNQQAMQGADVTTPEGLMQYAQKIKDISPARAAQAVAMARKMKEEDSQAKLRESQAKYWENRAPNLISYNSEIGPITFNPADGTYQDAEGNPLSNEDVKKLTLTRSTAGAKGGAGNSSTTQIMRVVDPVTGVVQFVRAEKGIGGKIEVLSANGSPLTPAEYSPTVKAQLAQAAAGGKEVGTQAAKALMEIPKVDSQITEIKTLGDKLFAHPGFQQFAGAKFPGLKAVAGSNVPGAAALYENIQGIASLMSRQELIGQGAITEGEAKMALAAFSRMNETMNEKDFKDAYADFVKRVENVRKILGIRSMSVYNLPAATIPMPESTAPSATVPIPQGVPQAPTVAMPTPTGDTARADQMAIYRQEYKNAQNKFASARTPQEQGRINDYIAGLRREAQRLGFSLEGENYPSTAPSLSNKNDVKAAYRSGKFGPVGSPDALKRANAILNQMESK